MAGRIPVSGTLVNAFTNRRNVKRSVEKSPNG